MSRALAIFGVLLLTSCKTPAAVETSPPAQQQHQQMGPAATQPVVAAPVETQVTRVVHPPRLEGTYEITKIELPLEDRLEIPAEAVASDPGYVFGRAAFVFGATTIRRRYEVVATPTGEAADSMTRVCMVEAQTEVRWLEQGLAIETPATAHAVAQTIARTESPTDQPEVFDTHWTTSEVTCSTYLPAGEYRLVEVSTDKILGRPRTVVLARGDEAVYFLTAADEKVDLRPAINEHFGRH